MLALLCTLIVACSDGAIEGSDRDERGEMRQAITRSLSIAVPLGTRPSELAASTSGQLKANDRASFRLETGGHPFAAGLGAGTLEVGSDAVTGSLISGGNVFLRERARVNGNVIAHGSRTAQNGVVVTGSVTQFADVPVKTWARTVEFPNTTLGPVNLEPNTSPPPLAPGSYAHASVKSGAKLRLRSGRYTFTSFTTEPQSEVHLDKAQGGIYIYVQDQSFLRNKWIDAGGAPADLLFTYLGTNALTVESPFRGTIIAPNAQLDLREVGPTGHRGAFFAQRLEVHSQTTVWKESMPSGIWDDADPCSFGLLQDDSCQTPEACPLTGAKACNPSEACECRATPGQQLPCLIETAGAGGTSVYTPASAGTLCFGPGGEGTCNGDGYCVVVSSNPDDGSSCTESAPAGGQFSHTPVPNGTPCSDGVCGADPNAACQSGVCSCVSGLPNDGNDCTKDSCSGSNCTHMPNPVLVGRKCHDGDCIGTCAASGECNCAPVSPAPEGAPLRILTANVAALPNTAGFAPTLGFGSCHTDWLGDADYECMAGKLAPKLLASDYDVIVLNEAFDDTYQDAIFDRLYGPVSEGRFPHVIRKLDASGWAAGYNAYNDSGLMLFSKWPFDRQVGTEKSCFDVSSRVDVEGAEIEQVNVPVGHGGLNTLSRVVSAVGFRPFDGGDAENGTDALVNKGVGFARIVAPTGFKYDVFFSHFQASYGEDVYEEWVSRLSARGRQLEIAQNLMGCLHGVGGAQAVVLAGDLNINGDVTNPSTPPLDFLALADDKARRNNNRFEWDIAFNPSAGDTSFFKTTVLDSWGSAMLEPSCVPGFLAEVNAACAVGPNPHAPFKGPVGYDRGFTWGEQEAEERLDYILFGSDGPRSATQRFGQFAPHHVTKAYNLWEGSAAEGGITLHPPAGQSAPKLAGSLILSDHIGLNGEIDFATPHSNPADARRIADEAADGGEVEMRLERRGVAQWLRIDKPGAYTFSVNPANHIPPRESSGITYRVYTADELSKPRVPYKGELLTSPEKIVCESGGGTEHAICSSIPAFREAKFKVAKPPLFVKVYHESRDYDPDYTGRYLFLYKRTQCTTRDEACDLIPFEEQEFLVNPNVTEGWFSFHVDKPDAARQNLKLRVTEDFGTPPEAVLGVEVIEASGNPLLHFGLPVELTRSVLPDGRGEWSHANPAVILEDHTDAFFGSKFYLKITRNPTVVDDFRLGVETETNLTWLYGADLGGSADTLKCKNTQEVGDDEIWMYGIPNGSDIGFPNQAAGAELSGGIDEDETTQWMPRFLDWYRSPLLVRRPRAILFTEGFVLRFFEDDPQFDETADRTFPALGDVVDRRDVPGGWWNFPKEFLINDGDNYKGFGPTISHYLEGRVCQTNDDCEAPLFCGGSLCVRP